jgi:hypothetical protein
VIDRQLAWSDARLQTLMQRFVPCADEVTHLQRAQTTAAKLFQSFCEEGHYGGRTKPTPTRQGIYAVTPSGKLLGSWNSRNVEYVALQMTAALAAWDALDDAQRYPRARLTSGPRAEDHYPEDGLVLQVFTRDIGRSAGDGGDWRQAAWNLDHLWLSDSEARALAEGALPEAAAQRLVRLHGRDNVRGQTPHFPREGVTSATLSVSGSLRDGSIQHLILTGEGQASTTGKWSTGKASAGEVERTRSFGGSMYGKATWNGERFTAFELAWTGLRSGATKYNQRGDDQAPAPMAVVFQLASPNDRVAPSRFWDYGWR